MTATDLGVVAPQADTLKTQERSLMDMARAAQARAYAPYSGFFVGAAVETEDGTIVTGVNVENASYGLTLCAERAAIIAAVAAGHRAFRRLAVSCANGPGATPEERTPCGQCRQVMAEFMDGQTPIDIDGVGSFKLTELLPLAFRLSNDQKPRF